MIRNLIIAFMFLTATLATRAGESTKQKGDAEANKVPFSGWIYPGSKPFEEVHFMVFDGKPGGISSSTGQYSTEAPFHEVIRFFVDKSGLEPPNWSILGREFPRDQINIPAHFFQQMGKSKTVSILHHLRPESATMPFLVTDLGGGETTCVTVSRGLRDDKTFIQIVRHKQT